MEALSDWQQQHRRQEDQKYHHDQQASAKTHWEILMSGLASLRGKSTDEPAYGASSDADLEIGARWFVGLCAASPLLIAGICIFVIRMFE